MGKGGEAEGAGRRTWVELGRESGEGSKRIEYEVEEDRATLMGSG